MKQIIISSLVVASFLGFPAGMAIAAPLTAAQTLNQFNLVVFGDATSKSDVDGRAYIGGDLSGGTYVTHSDKTPASSYAGLTTGGNASRVMVNGFGAVIGKDLSYSTINSGNAVVLGTARNNNFNGPAYVAKSGSGNNFNGGKNPALATGTAATAATSTDFKSVLTGLSIQLKSLASTGSSVTFTNNKAVFNAVADKNGVAVFNLSGIDTVLFNKGEFEFNLNGANTVILDSDETKINIAANFLGGAAQSIGAKTIWNFYNATDVDIQNQFGGSVLAPLAHFSNENNIEGGVYVNTLTQNGEIHLQPFSGHIPPTPVPAPPAMLLLGSGMACLANARWKRRNR
ncbi:MAG TPA: choice-of-anchor A family protein [Geobacteraceae bacterium]|nr:choice-of-anchor A family protein [Geobacteraceae bacterium]